jgi:hypothetical protein
VAVGGRIYDFVRGIIARRRVMEDACLGNGGEGEDEGLRDAAACAAAKGRAETVAEEADN